MLLTKQEEKLVRETWAVGAQDLKGLGSSYLLHFFKMYPWYQKLFRGFEDVPHDKLVENRRFKAHAFTVVNAVNGLVENVDDPDLFSELLVKQGKNHAQHSLKTSDFENLKTSLIDYFQKYNNKWSPEAEAAWSKLLSVLVDRASEGLRAAEAATKS